MESGQRAPFSPVEPPFFARVATPDAGCTLNLLAPALGAKLIVPGRSPVLRTISWRVTDGWCTTFPKVSDVSSSRLRSREHVSAVAVAAAVHQGRVRVPCASSATLGNSTERVNGDLELERRFGYRPWSRFRCRMV